MTKEELIKLLRGNLWIYNRTGNDQDIMGIDIVAEKIAMKFIQLKMDDGDD